MNPNRSPLLVCVLLLALLAGCSRNRLDKTETIRVRGSDTMLLLAQAWAETYAGDHPTTNVEVSGGGSGQGIAALTKGAIDLADSSRNIHPEESATALQNTGKTPQEFVVGHDALAVFVHPGNPMNSITIGELSEIFRAGGGISKWSQLGIRIPSGRDNIIRVNRQSSSGTYEFFREHVLDTQDFRLGSLDMNGSKEVVELIASTPGAIGYSGMGFATSQVKMLSISTAKGGPAFAPSVANVVSRRYPISRSLLIYTLGEPPTAVRNYLDWIRSPAGQEIVAATGYVPLGCEGKIAKSLCSGAGTN